MKQFAVAAVTALSLAAPVEAEEPKSPRRSVVSPDVQATVPALANYTDDVLFGDVWKRPELAPRDRSIVTVSALIAGGHTAQMTGHFNRALDNGVKPEEITAIITHLAFYSGWPKAMSSVAVAKAVFEKRGVDPAQLAAVSGEAIAFDEAAEARRKDAVDKQVGGTVPALARYTNGVLFGDLWRRADLAPRDRSLVTIAALIADSQVNQLPFHLNRGMDSGLSQTEISEVITHLAFYAGWPKAMSAVPVAKTVFQGRASAGSNPQSVKGNTRMEIIRSGSEPSKGPAEYFTGSVSVASRFQREAPARIGGAIVSFEPGARTAWHTHPLGQTLIVTSGTGWVQREGGPVEEMRVGDVVWIPPGEKHWHGATATSPMTHVAIAEALDGKTVDWLEKVTDEKYGAR
ncbi:carboxymuconolactone decarboxylase family protein [Flaviflagellibacter deserti]|uniref:Carboxymuconolactone decarboxylase family protein n=1 Tax=Flaviflagellibacter deserti TaxID=2267266 RepID=A0ABV9YXB1_9HYPH